MNRMWTILRKELIHILRDPQSLSLVIIMPVMMLFLLGYAIAQDIEDIPLAVVDQSRTEASRNLINQFEVSGFFEWTHSVEGESEILRLMDAGTVKAGMLIPEYYGRRLDTGAEADILFYVDGSNPSVAQAAQLAAETISQAASQEILIQRLSRSPLPFDLKLPITAHLRFLYNPDMRSMNFLVPGLIAAILQIQTLLLTAFSIVREREQGTLEQLIVTPIRSWELMLGKILPFVLVAFVNLAMTVLVAMIFFRVPIAGSAMLLAALSMIFLLGSLGLGILISNISRTQMQALHLTSFIMLPTFILSGFLFPRDNMPLVAYYSGYLLPITYFLEIVRGIILKGVGLAQLWPWVWPMAVFSIIVFVASVILFRKRID